jgi:hypothetical protein
MIFKNTLLPLLLAQTVDLLEMPCVAVLPVDRGICPGVALQDIPVDEPLVDLAPSSQLPLAQ